MKRPTIDLANLPDLETLPGLSGPMRTPNPAHDDTIVVLMTIVYESAPPGGNI
jgi:hypothetical protein